MNHLYGIGIYFFMVLCFSACSLKGGGDVSVRNAEQVSLPSASDESLDELNVISYPDAESHSILTRNLKVDEGFIFQSSTSLHLDIKIITSEIKPDRLTVCRIVGYDKVDYSECLYSGPINELEFSKQFMIPNNLPSVAAILWTFGEKLEKNIYRWDKSHGNYWVLEI